MLSVSNLSVQFGKRVLFDEVNTKFIHGNCYGIIGENGSGKIYLFNNHFGCNGKITLISKPRKVAFIT